jgi:hypothetical protein
VKAQPYPGPVTTILARYRRHGDTAADPGEVTVEAADYDTALAEARARAVDGDDLLSVLTLEP